MLEVDWLYWVEDPSCIEGMGGGGRYAFEEEDAVGCEFAPW